VFHDALPHDLAQYYCPTGTVLPIMRLIAKKTDGTVVWHKRIMLRKNLKNRTFKQE